MEENNKSNPIKSETELPPGNLISYTGDDLALTEKNRKEMLAWDMSRENNKVVAIYAVRTAYQSNPFLQLIKNAQTKGYRVARQGIIEPNVLNAIYDKRSNLENQKANGDDSLVVHVFEMILADALAETISDIHIEVRPTSGIIRMRKHGELLEYNPDKRLTYQEANDLCSVIYTVLASTKEVSFKPTEYQQASVNYNVGGQDLKLRYQSLPAYPDGFDVVLRVLPIGKSEEFTPLQKLGYTEQQVLDLINITSRPVGGLIIAGITGSGKSTTLKNLLMFINANSGYRTKIYTIEDPPEYNIAKVTQIPVVNKSQDSKDNKSPFEIPIKACMRADPDVIMIGEVRDTMTGDLMKKAIQSGHQVLTTVHTTSALGIIERFQDFGLTKSVLGSPEFLSGLLYQKLLPEVCQDCAISFNKHLNNSEATQKDLDLFHRISKYVDPREYDIKIRSAQGCSSCKGRGITGRTVIAEIITLDLKMIQYIEKGETIPLMIYWRSLSDGKYDSDNMKGKTCMEHGFQKMLNGIISPYDLESEFKPIDEMILSEKDVDVYNSFNGNSHNSKSGLISEKNIDNSNKETKNKETSIFTEV